MKIISEVLLNYFSFMILIFVVLPFFSITSPVLSLSDPNTTFNNNSTLTNSNDWTVGVSVGDKRTLNYTHCTDYCATITPVGTLSTHEILAINDTHVTYERTTIFPNDFDASNVPSWVEGIFVIPRQGFEPFPPPEGSFHPLTTTNLTLLKKTFDNFNTRNVTIFEFTFHIEVHEYYYHDDFISDYNLTYHKKTGWLVAYRNIVRDLSGAPLAEIKSEIIIEDPLPPTNLPLYEQILVIGILIFFLFFLGLLLYRSKYTQTNPRNQPFKTLLEPEHFQFLRQLYHKLVMGLANPKTPLLSNENLSFTNDIKTSLSTSPTIIANLFPPQIRKDITSEIRGRSVLILVELAYQPLENAFSNYFSKALNIPHQTVSFELKKLVELDYIQTLQTPTTLQDTRFKYYKLTHKGTLFLYLLKETIAYTLIQSQ
jgi:DNA-binding MarR family transcriptional regulator